ncbi:MAG: glycosyltransferase family 2 protein [Steroidobacteraceae bacterium]
MKFFGGLGMAEDPLVSIILPVYNGARYLREAIDSALAQTYLSIEVIAVDDGSTDSSPEILRSYHDKIRNIRQTNRGAAAARNVGIREGRGQYLAFLDADDVWSSQKLRRQVAYLSKHPDVMLVSNRWREWRQDEPCPQIDEGCDGTETLYLPHSGWIYSDLLLDCIVHTTTVVMDRRLVAQIGLFEEALLRGQDYDYWLRASRVTPIHKLDAVLSAYRVHAASSIQRPMEQNFPSLVLERALQRWGRTGPDGRTTSLFRMRKRIAREWYTFGNMHWRAGNRRRATYAFMRCIAAWPLHVRAWISLVTSGLLPRRAEQNG